MPQPTKGDVHVDSLLTNISVGFMQKAEDFVADRVFPIVPVTKQSDRYTVYDRSFWYRSEMKERAPGTESAGAGYAVDTTPTYFAPIWALHKDIDDPTRANTDAPMDADVDATRFLAQQALIRKDKLWVAKYFTTGLWTGDQTGVAAAPGANQFLQFNVANSIPFKVIRAQRNAIKQRTGYWPNTLVLGSEVWSILADHPDLLDRIKYTGEGGRSVSPELLASALEIDRVLIASGVENTGAEGAAAAYSFLAGKNMLLVYSAPSPSLFEPSGGYTFSWTGLLGANSLGGRIKNFRMEHLESDRIEIEMAFDQKLIAADMGAFFSAAVG